jgi:inorganic phosphate transporter, PiT family
MQLFGLIIVIAIALAFDFVNGFHDAANSIATVVSTGVLSPRLAVLWAAFFNFVAFLVFGTVVAATIATGIVDPDVLSIGVVFAGLIGAIGWNLITFYLGLPTSSSHALVGASLAPPSPRVASTSSSPAAYRRSASSSSCRRFSGWRSASH